MKEAERLQKEVAKKMEKEREKEMMALPRRRGEAGKGGKKNNEKEGGKKGETTGKDGKKGAQPQPQALIPANTIDVDIREDREIGREGEKIFSFQTEAVRWLFGHWSKAHNCIMADASGLGLFLFFYFL